MNVYQPFDMIPKMFKSKNSLKELIVQKWTSDKYFEDFVNKKNLLNACKVYQHCSKLKLIQFHQNTSIEKVIKLLSLLNFSNFQTIKWEYNTRGK